MLRTFSRAIRADAEAPRAFLGDDVPMPLGKIVVGVDGSPGSEAALRWAVAEARLRDAELVVLHVWWARPELDPEASALGERSADSPEALVKQFVDKAAPDARSSLAVTSSTVQGVAAAAALVDASKDADLLVLGSRGLGGFKGLLLGSVSEQCAHHALCPVVIVHP